MKIFYLEKRLDELSPDQNDLAIRENIDLKVKIHTLGQELKKYKNMILELNQAMAMVQQQQQCTRPHGMSEEEQLEYENALTSADAFRLENDQLQKLVSEQRMENARLRLVCSQRLGTNNNNNVVKSLSSSSTSSSSSSSSSQHQQQSLASSSSSNNNSSNINSNNSNKDLLERYKKSWAQAKQTIQEQNETIAHLKDTIQHHQTTIASSSALERRDWIDMEENLAQTRKRNRDLQSQVRHAANEVEDWKRRTAETKKALEKKCIDYDELLLQMDHDHQHRQEDDDQRRHELEKERDEAQQLHETTQQLLDQREQDMELLEEEMEKVVRHAEALQKQLEDKDLSWEDETARLRQWYSEQQQELTIHWQEQEAQLEAAHTQEQQDAKQRYDDDLQLLEVKFNQVEQSIRERDVRIASLEGHLDAQTDAAQREKQLGQEDIKDLEDQLADALTTVQHQKQQLDHYMQLASPNTPTESSQDLEVQVQSLQSHLKEAEDRLKRDRYAANQALNDAMKSQHLLQQTLDTVRKRNELLTSLLDQCQNPDSKISGKRLDKATRLLTKLNQELHHELEDRDRQLETERGRAQQLDELYAQSLEELAQAEQLLIRRDNMITRALERIESDKEKKEVLENVLRRQATEDLDIVLQSSMDSSTS
ncbi:hypothetical protein BCR42DRAFT_67085 [Absidia repens]|uniref:Centrosomin N-terminal motif 1 domain-containing protein n=1 Tax=Absidia repens TaxID=90262 RepID=A0A1X2IBY3_9FUNG|nr:hypothetical protein BCR42DRAFT_67085 [Absidia repens]